MVVEHPRRDFSYDEVLSDVFDAMRKYGVRNPHFIGHSFGGQIAMTVMREYKRRGCPHGPIGRSVMVCVPVVTSDIKAPLPLSWAQYVKGGPLLNKLVWPWAQPLFRKLGPRQALAPGVDPAWAREHRRFMDKFPVRGCFAQAVEMYRHKAPANGEFADVWALIICTAGEDMFVRPKAVQRLQAAFPNHRVVALPGVHANLVEEAPSYTKAIASFLLANQRVS
jgi:pimeloyl-ACP methyl ester carboxylesterase